MNTCWNKITFRHAALEMREFFRKIMTEQNGFSYIAPIPEDILAAPIISIPNKEFIEPSQ